MNHFQISRRTFMTFAALFMAVLLTVGCSEGPRLVGSDQDEVQVLRRNPAAAAKVTDDTLYIEQVISSKNGGRLVLLDVTLDIPPGAIPHDTLFSISIPDVQVFFNEFGTDGLVFLKPITVTMSYRDADMSDVEESTIRIAWLNESTGEYEDMICEVDFENKMVTGQLDHFSAYALISDNTRPPF